jgi:hypothetical protein
MDFIPSEKTATIRYPSIAHLMVDSADRNAAVYEYCNDFQITKNNSLLNGFFTRIGATEVVFEWLQPNVYQNFNSYFTYTVDGDDYSFNVSSGFFTVAEALDGLVSKLNAVVGYTGLVWSVDPLNGTGAGLSVQGPDLTTFSIDGNLIRQLYAGPIAGTVEVPSLSLVFYILSSVADLRPTRYVDIVCNQLTNNQSVKDASTASSVRDVLVRWYFDFDNQNPTDAYAFPILMGYAPFFLRRLYNPPKQIQWQTNIPVGNLTFQLYGADGKIQPVNANTNFLMTLQISEN